MRIPSLKVMSLSPIKRDNLDHGTFVFFVGAHLGNGKIDIAVLCGTPCTLEENAKMDRAQQRYLKKMSKRVLVLRLCTGKFLRIPKNR